MYVVYCAEAAQCKNRKEQKYMAVKNVKKLSTISTWPQRSVSIRTVFDYTYADIERLNTIIKHD